MDAVSDPLAPLPTLDSASVMLRLASENAPGAWFSVPISISIHSPLTILASALAPTPTVAPTITTAAATIVVCQPNRLLKDKKVTLQHLSPVLYIANFLELVRRSVGLTRKLDVLTAQPVRRTLYILSLLVQYSGIGVQRRCAPLKLRVHHVLQRCDDGTTSFGDMALRLGRGERGLEVRRWRRRLLRCRWNLRVGGDNEEDDDDEEPVAAAEEAGCCEEAAAADMMNIRPSRWSVGLA
ncbi:unnamed protein product [Fusarium venenatum]|uniref:Uncharacterized protein n=1 Tax=Fusarium venenatum TaxID=56646 RepID=A0A2L2T174_9HYPO|nr:uncharacterized protein FVRRES_00806 [Fusarium venenatum]CEI64294.1 unnamed protein product [Fusarium venenatum]